MGVTFALYDQDGNLIGTAIDNINDLTPDSTWKYTAMTLDTQQFASFELTSVDASYKYGWNWGITRGLINRRFGTNYTADELKELYDER